MNDSLAIADLFSVKGKVALVTGASRGIGEMIARGLVTNGVRTYITSRKAAECEATASALNELGAAGECITLPADLSQMDAIEAIAADLGSREARLDILVNNAGATWGAEFETFPESGWDKTVDLNLKSPFFLVQKLLPLLAAAGTAEDPARVINIASIDGMFISGGPNFAYTASKAAIIHLSRHLANRLAASHVNVNAIAPGFFETRMMAHVEPDDLIKDIPLGRSGRASDAAGAALFLSSKAGAWITGATIPVDGGLVGCS